MVSTQETVVYKEQYKAKIVDHEPEEEGGGVNGGYQALSACYH